MSNIVWVDVETTGLSVKDDYLLEVSFIVTNERLEMLEGPFTRTLWPSQGWENALDHQPFVKEMHTKNGLIRDVHAIFELPKEERRNHLAWHVSLDIRTWLERFGEAGTMVLAGSTVNFDRNFLDEEMPEVTEYLHYRNIDVSTVKRCVQMWHPDVYREWVDSYQSTDKAHRAETDLRESIAELAFYKERVFDAAKLAIV